MSLLDDINKIIENQINYNNEYPSTCNWTTDLSFLIKKYVELDGDFKTLLKIYKLVEKNIATITIEQLQKWLADGTLENLITEAILKDLDTLKNNFYIIKPSNDQSGVTDLKNIQEALDNHVSVYLESGEYYINRNLTIKEGYSLKGVSYGEKSVIHVVNYNNAISQDINISADHVFLENLYFQNDSFNKVGSVGMYLIGSKEYPYTGARYSRINNIDFEGFETLVWCSGIWSTIFNNIRNYDNVNCKYGIYLENLCNNLTFNDCEITGCTSYGVGATPNGTELYHIKFNNCNFERCKTAFDISGVISFIVNNCYGEKINTIIKANSCPNLTIQNCTFTSTYYFGSIENSAYSSIKFKKPNVNIKNIYITTNSNTDGVMLDLNNLGNTFIDNIQLINEGTGNVYFCDFINTNYNVSIYNVNNNSIQYSTDFKKRYVDINYQYGDSIKLLDFGFECTKEFTLSSSITLSIQLKNETIGSITIPNGTITTGKYITGTVSVKKEYAESMTINVIPNTTPSSPITGNFFFKFISGNNFKNIK